MTLDDLEKLYRAEIAKAQYPGWDEKHRAGVRIIVEALRDEMDDFPFRSEEIRCCGQGVPNHDNSGEECCRQPDQFITRRELYNVLNEILASDGEEKAAGRSTREDERELHDLDTRPAADLAEENKNG